MHSKVFNVSHFLLPYIMYARDETSLHKLEVHYEEHSSGNNFAHGLQA